MCFPLDVVSVFPLKCYATATTELQARTLIVFERWFLERNEMRLQCSQGNIAAIVSGRLTFGRNFRHFIIE